jgi:hypothetical protein
MGRYGDSSLIVYSQFITDDLLRQYEYEFNFLEKGEYPVKFIEKALAMMHSLRKRQAVSWLCLLVPIMTLLSWQLKGP